MTAGGRAVRPARATGGASGRDLLARILGGAAGALLRAWSRRTLPRAGRLRVPGLCERTRVRFDDHGVPHIRAATEADALRALGACHALDRFFQMDMTRRLLRGTLCEVVGERPLGTRALPPLSKGTTLDADRLMRVLDLVRAAGKALAAATADERHLLDAYVEGVNAGVTAVSARDDYRLRVSPALDTSLVGKGMALGLSFKWRAGPVCAAMAEALEGSPERLSAILPRAPAGDVPAIARVAAETRGLAAALSFLGWDALPAGSNSFLVGGARSASGKPVLANDPHLELSLPPVWYLASVSGGAYAAVGATMPGIPAVLSGRTPSVAWGVTNAMLDDGDLWAEQVDGTGTRYFVDGRWREMEVETQEIRRRGGAPFVFRLRRTHRGPLLTDALPGAAGKPLSLRLTLHETLHDLQAFLALGRARTAGDVEAATRGYGSPAQNLVWATAEGEAGYRLMGRVPVRPGGEPALPRDGTTTASDWAGAVPEAALPAFRIAPEGQVVTANDPQAAGAYPHYLSNLYEPGYRAARIRQRLAGRRGLTPRDLAEIQMDVTSLGAEAFRRVVLLPNAEAVRAAKPSLGALVDRLLATGPLESVDDVGPALLHWTYFHLAKRVFEPGIGEGLLRRLLGCVNLIDAPLLRAFSDAASPWVEPSVRPTLLGQAIEDAARDLASRGLKPEARWGSVHTLTLRHPLSAVPVLGRAWTRGPFEMAGGPFTPCAGQYLHDRPAAMVVGASYRHVVDMADPEAARMVVFGGQSGNVGSPHYDDLLPLWLKGEGAAIAWTAEAVEKATVETLRLRPARIVNG